jgi:membrane protein YdbS with pleckstrin-like domain
MGTHFILLTWNKIQSVEIEQSLYQQKHGLANLSMQTAGGEIRVPYIELTTAHLIRNYALYKIETSKWS